MNLTQRIQFTESDLIINSSTSDASAFEKLPVLHRRAGVVVDAENDVSPLQLGTDHKETIVPGQPNTGTRKQKSPVVVIVVGMAGSGKTTLVSQLQHSLQPPPPPTTISPSTYEENETEFVSTEKTDLLKDTDDKNERESGVDSNIKKGITKSLSQRVGYCINLDPATNLVPFAASIDIRDTIDYKQVMIQHQLGPNGAIMTALNLFATKFDQVIQILEQRSFTMSEGASLSSGGSLNPDIDYILVDTPGQIEAFTWSASGSIMTSGLSSSFPTVLAFVVDTPRCVNNPSTFMSNMLYACSMLYRTRLPVLLVFNKTDVISHNFCVDWMTDYDSFQEALDDYNENNSDSGYYGSLTRSLSLMLDKFYSTLHHVGVSAATGDGIDSFWNAVTDAAKEFDDTYVSHLKNQIEEQHAKEKVRQRKSMKRFEQDFKEKV